ncbi:MAG: HigA family addiction module antitoxin [Coriobacteriia bacterium]|nr:HigA family addiction module antitoxin [Coriobacteriia bacterium]
MNDLRTHHVHPGEVLREDFLPEYGLDVPDFSQRLCLPVDRVRALLLEQEPIDAELALRLGRLFGNSGQFWMNLQRDADLAEARGRLRSELMHVRGMSDTGWAASSTADGESWRDWMSATTPSDTLSNLLKHGGGVSTAYPAIVAGLSPERLHALASGAERFTVADDATLSAAFGYSLGYWLRAQAIADATSGIDAGRPELGPAERVRDVLARIEVEQDVRILYAVESGSRAWGFASTDSDYDVRFLYAHRPEWYLTTQRRSDVIERPIEGDLDVSGWDLPKALHLLGKSNPPLLEWLRSPIVYLESGSLAPRMLGMADRFVSPGACMHHYLHMAGGNFREYLQGEQVWLKKYFYVLRPVLACRWIEGHDTLPPVEFEELADEVLPQQLRMPVADLLVRKRAGEELDRGPRIRVLSEFLAEEISRLSEVARNQERAQPPDRDDLDALMREILRQTWAAT